jgi:hypothetical protein
MPFAGYTDFAACVAANKDKGDPEAYCATIQRAVEKRNRTRVEKLLVERQEEQERITAIGPAAVP